MRSDKKEAVPKILTALEGILEMQRTIRRGLDPCVQTGLVFLRFYYEELPADGRPEQEGGEADGTV